MKVQCAHAEMVDIPGWPAYWASKSGRIVSKKTGIPLREALRKDGHIVVQMFDQSKDRYRLQPVHRLICSAFWGPAQGEVNHKNGDRADNRPENLEWAARPGNIRPPVDALNKTHLKAGFGAIAAKITEADFDKIVRWSGANVMEPSELAKFFGVNKATVMRHLRRSKQIAKKHVHDN